MTKRGRLEVSVFLKRVWWSIRHAWQSPRRVWLAIGGLAGLAAIATLCAPLLQLFGLSQDTASSAAQDAAQATLIAIGREQLDVQRQIATFQASDAITGPTATANAEQIVRLVSTGQALEAERQLLEATLSAIPTQPAPAPNASVTTRVPSQVQDVDVELVELTRFQNTITARFRFINSGAQAQIMRLTFTSYLLDEATQRTYAVNFESNSGSTAVPANDTIEAWAKYEISPDDHPQYLTVVLPNGVSFDHIPVQQ